ncbi:cob(I)yrinic acid a,c-diamide adenosyltransferase [Pseudomonadota bacterium]
MEKKAPRIYTRTGDQGTTVLGDGRRVEKDSLRIEAIGSIDELNSFLGMLVTKNLPDDIKDSLRQIQHQLFGLGAELAAPGHYPLPGTAITVMEQQMDELSEALPPLKAFILPGGSPAAATCHYARSLCRQAERRVVALSHQEEVDAHIKRYLNRLSDLLFVMARSLNQAAGGMETPWHHE